MKGWNTSYGTDADKEDVLLPAGRNVVVMDTNLDWFENLASEEFN